MIRFKATGNAPILKQNVFKVSASSQFQVVIGFLRRQLGFKPSDPLVSAHSPRLPIDEPSLAKLVLVLIL